MLDVLGAPRRVTASHLAPFGDDQRLIPLAPPGKFASQAIKPAGVVMGLVDVPDEPLPIVDRIHFVPLVDHQYIPAPTPTTAVMSRPTLATAVVWLPSPGIPGSVVAV